jgi:heat shock protein HslJ
MRTLVAAWALAGLMIAACSGSGSGSSPTPPTERDVAGVWVLSAIEPEPAAWHTDRSLTMELRADHRLLAEDQCNKIVGQWTLPSGRDLVLHDVAITVMACPDHPDILGFPWQSVRVDLNTTLTVHTSDVVLTYTR